MCQQETEERPQQQPWPANFRGQEGGEGRGPPPHVPSSAHWALPRVPSARQRTSLSVMPAPAHSASDPQETRRTVSLEGTYRTTERVVGFFEGAGQLRDPQSARHTGVHRVLCWGLQPPQRARAPAPSRGCSFSPMSRSRPRRPHLPSPQPLGGPSDTLPATCNVQVRIL